MSDLEYLQQNWHRLSDSQKAILKTMGIEQNGNANNQGEISEQAC